MRIQVRWTVFLLVTAALFCASTLLGPMAQAQDKSLVWERFDVDIEVNASGTFDVTESQTIRFTDGTFTFGYRDIPIQNFSYIDNWAISDRSGNSYRLASGGAEPYSFTVDNTGGHYVIRWYFPPARNSSETYELSYTVHDGLRFYEGGDQVWWKAIYGERSFPVLEGRVRVIVPNAATIQEWAAYINERDARDSASANLVGDGQAILFELGRRLQSGEEMEVRVEFTPGIVDAVVQPWQEAADAETAQREAALAYRDRWGPIATLGLLALGMLLVLGGPAGLYALWYRRWREHCWTRRWICRTLWRRWWIWRGAR
jgi:hypothetical protein